MKTYDLAPSQIPEWYAYQLNPKSSVYNISFNHFFFKEIDPKIFCKVWQQIIDRHLIFRIHFTYAEGKPKQALLPPIQLDFNTVLIDKTTLALTEVNAVQNRLAQEFALSPLDFEKGPLFRLHLVAYPEREFQLIFTVHHIIWDETSTMNLIREFTELYAALEMGKPVTLPPLKTTYFDYVERVNQAITRGDYERHRQYWLARFQTLPPPLNLPTDYPRPAIQTYHGNTLNQWLPRTLVRQIQVYLVKNNTTLFILLLAILNLYFYRIQGQGDIILGCPIAGRDDAEFKNLLGCFAVPMPIRVEVTAQMQFEDVLQQVSARVLEAFEHYHYPCNQVIESLIHKKDLSRPKLFSVMAGVQNNKSEFLHISVGRGTLFAKEVYSAENHGARFDLAIGLDPLGGDIKLFCTYNTDLFKESTVTSMLASLIHLFAEVIAKPDLLVTQYSLLASAFRKQILVDFNASNVSYNEEATLIDEFFAMAQQQPDAVALQIMKETVTYAELVRRVMQCATYFRQKGITPGELVCVLFDPGVEMIICLLAIMQLGATYVPLHPEWPIARQQLIRAKLPNSKLLTAADVLAANQIEIFETTSLARPEGLAYILFTSGTTGTPKAIPIHHKGIMNLLAATQRSERLSKEDRVLFWTPYTFDPSLLEIFWPLCFGAQIVIPPSHIIKLPYQMLAFIKEQCVTILQTVPTMLDALCTAAKDGDYGLRLIICGAAVMQRSLRDRVLQRFACRLMNHYGPTEVTVDALKFDCTEDFVGHQVPLGKPLDNVKVFILDENGEPVPLGIIGEICIVSPGLTPGYFNDPELTAARFFYKSLGPNEELLRLYHTGDLGRFDEKGNVYFVGRKDHQVKIHGNRVELGEIESVLLQHPDLAQVALQWEDHPTEPRLRCFLELQKQALNVFEAKGRKYYQFTLAQKPEMLRFMNSVHHDTWPQYFEGSPFLAHYWQWIIQEFPAYQFCLVDENDQIACVANGIPLYWSGEKATLPTGWDQGIEWAFKQKEMGISPNTILGLAGIVCPAFQGKGLSSEIVKGFRALAKLHGLDQFLGPVRPVGMFDYDIQDVAVWAESRDSSQEPLDYWLRVHERLGAVHLGVALQSQLVEGSLADWKRWTGQFWQKSGIYYWKETLQGIEVNVEKNYARYYDPSIWVGHFNLQQQVLGPSYPREHHLFRDYLAATLPAYMLPNEFYFLPKLPLTENGKINLQALPSFSPAAVHAIMMPETPKQVFLLECWQNILQRNDFGITDDFFHLGGQSLKVVQMLWEIEKQYGIKISLQAFYHQPTIFYLEQLIKKEVHCERNQ